MPSRRYTLMDLFSGCGGMTRGFVDTGRFKPVFAVDEDRDAVQTYTANFGRAHAIAARIEDVTEFPLVDVVVGGPPCQGFSPLNRRGVGLERRRLWRQYIRALAASKPSAFVMENVPQLLESREYGSFRRSAEELGFHVEGRVLNAADFGVPQNRKRAFVVGVRDDDPSWPTETHGDPDELPIDRTPWLTFRDAVGGLSVRPDGFNWHRPRRPKPTSLVRYRAVPRDGGNRFQMQENLERQQRGDLVLPCFRRKPTGTTDVFGRLWWDRPAVTIRTEFYKPEKGRYLHPTAHRPITVREAARCMAFADSFRFPEEQSMTSVARQIGNAVPPLLARRIAETVADVLDARSRRRRAA
jgi:DNA (cytosine-5)-methyltransferase 1